MSTRPNFKHTTHARVEFSFIRARSFINGMLECMCARVRMCVCQLYVRIQLNGSRAQQQRQQDAVSIKVIAAVLRRLLFHVLFARVVTPLWRCV